MASFKNYIRKLYATFGYPLTERHAIPSEALGSAEKRHGIRRAYSRRHQVLCTLPAGDLPFMNQWSVLIGEKTKADLHAIANELRA